MGTISLAQILALPLWCQKSAPAMRGREGDYSVSSGAKDDGDGEEVRSQLGNLQLVGNVEGRHVIIVDDMIATGKSLVTVAKLLKAEGAKSVSCFATHGVFAGNAMEVIDECDDLDEVVVTNTIPARQGVQISNKVKYLSLGCVIADVIEKINLKDSLRKTSLVVYAADEEDDAICKSRELVRSTFFKMKKELDKELGDRNSWTAQCVCLSRSLPVSLLPELR